MVHECLWRIRARHAVPLLPEKSENEQRESAMEPSIGDGGAFLRWHSRHFHEPPIGGRLCLLKAPLALGEGLVLGWRYRWCSRGAPVLLHWLWKTSASGRGKCGTYRVPWKMVRASF